MFSGNNRNRMGMFSHGLFSQIDFEEEVEMNDHLNLEQPSKVVLT